MNNIQIELFWSEIEQIQLRHSLFFPAEQKRFIKVSAHPDAEGLTFLPGYDLSECITLEIKLTFKILSDCRFPE